MLQTANGMKLYCQKDEGVHHMLHRVFVNNKLCVGHVNRASCVQKSLDLRGSKKCRLVQVGSGLVHFNCRCTSLH